MEQQELTQELQDERRISTLEADVKNLTGWQTKQNGCIVRVEQKVDKLQYWIMGAVGVAALNLLGLVGGLLALLMGGK